VWERSPATAEEANRQLLTSGEIGWAAQLAAVHPENRDLRHGQLVADMLSARQTRHRLIGVSHHMSQYHGLTGTRLRLDRMSIYIALGSG
jgi:hypothetical protein